MLKMKAKWSAESSHQQRPMHLLDLPLDVLTLIFEAYVQVYNGSGAASWCRCFGKADQHRQPQLRCRSWDLERVNFTIRKMFRHFLANRRWRIDIAGDNAAVYTDLRCPKLWDLTPPRHLDIRFHGFYNLSALPTALSTLSALCRKLQAVNSLRYLRIDIDSALPRPREPFNIDLIELERAPLVVLILLQPFKILHRIPDAHFNVRLGTAHRPLLRDTPITGLIARIQKHLTSANCFIDHGTRSLSELERRLHNHEKFWTLWKDPIASCLELDQDDGEYGGRSL
jgi:hypothetical protein